MLRHVQARPSFPTSDHVPPHIHLEIVKVLKYLDQKYLDMSHVSPWMRGTGPCPSLSWRGAGGGPAPPPRAVCPEIFYTLIRSILVF